MRFWERYPVAATGAALAVAAAVYWVAFDGGSYAVTSWTALGVAVWWVVLLLALAGFVPAGRPPVEAILAGVALAGLAALAGVSALWGDSAERAYTEAARVGVYAGVFALAALGARPGTAPRWIAGVALGLVAVVVTALATRLFPGLVEPTAQIAQIFPAAERRLSYPVNYWNGLATLGAFALPLLLFVAASARSSLLRGVAVLPIPAVAATIYLTSSRGGAISALLGVLVFTLLAPRLLEALVAAVVAGAGSAAAVAVLLARPELVDTPIAEAAAAEPQGRSAAVLIAAICAGAGILYALASLLLRRARPASVLARAALAGAVAVIGLATIVALDPVQRFEDFRAPPTLELREADVQSHLFSGSGNGRWQFWQAAIEQFEERPLVGKGGGSYEAWWTQHGTLPVFVRNAHSLYLETLGELGVLGLLLLVAFLVTCLVAGVRRLLGPTEPERAAAAALLGVAAAFVFEAGIDWIWEIPGVTAVAVACLGLLAGSSLRPPGPVAAPSLAARAAMALVALGLVAVQAVPFLAETNLRNSREAAARGDLPQALDQARAAQSLEPWAASPRLQAALVLERAGSIDPARRALAEALERDPADWRLWLISARLETKAGEADAAARALARARELNPRSPLFAAD